MTTFEAAEKFFLCGNASSGHATSRPAFSGAESVSLVPPERSQSPTEVDSSGEEVGGSVSRSGPDGIRRSYGAIWLRRHVKKNVAGGVYASHESVLNRVRGGGTGGLPPLFEEHTISGYPRDTYSHHPYSRQLAASDANLNLRRYNTSLTLFPSGRSTNEERNYFNRRVSGGSSDGSGSLRPPQRMTTIGATKLFGSSPQLAGSRAGAKLSTDSNGKLPDIKSLSVPHDINLNSSLDSSASKLPNIPDNNSFKNSDARTEQKQKRQRRRKKTQLSRGLDASEAGTISTGTITTTTCESVVKTHTTGEEDDEDDYDEDFFSEEELNPFDNITLTTDSSYVPPEGSPSSQRIEAERLAEEEVRHNWLLDEDNKSRMKRFESRCNRLMINVSDQDTVDAIEDRLEELRMMAKPRKDERSVLDRLTEEQRERILRMNEIPVATLRKGRRKGWKPIHKLRWASSMIRLLSNGVQTRRQYVNKTTEMGGQMRRRLDGGHQDTNTDTGTPDKPSLGLDLLLALTTQPHLRTQKTVKRILWLLRATKAFKNLFPAEMEMELAKVVGYERYDDGRIITKQGRAPDRFYYIISGKIGLFRQYQLSTGQVTKGMGFLTKGMTTDPEMMEKQRCREDSLVAKGQVEVLIVEKDAFSYLQHTTVGPPIDFLKSLDLFEEFPVERFSHNPDAIEYTYYGTGKIIVKDSNRTPWLHIVKSGRVKVIRSQSVIDAHASNESKFVTPRIEALGCGKPFSHANAMLGVQAKQRQLKSTAQFTLPQIAHEEPLVSNPFGTTLGVESVASPTPHSSERPNSHRQTPISRQSGESESSPKSKHEDENDESMGMEQEKDENKEGKDKDAVMDSVATEQEGHQKEYSSPPPNDPALGEEQEGEQDQPSDGLQPPEGDTARHSAAHKRRRKDATLPIINIPTRDPGESYKPHPLWLTRERTDETGTFDGSGRKRSKEQVQRQAYLQLGVLGPGDVFGLDHMQPALASEAQGVSLLSDGAEVIKISKRFFLQNAGNNTMLKVETMCNEYISEEEAQQVLFDKETWSQYKHALWERMTAGLPQVTTV